jgi:uncharacterized protein
MWPIETTHALMFASGLLGGFGHCIGMCGPVAAALALGFRGRSALLPQLLYSLGRLTTYALLGGAVGLSGSLLGVTASLASVQRAVAVGTGLLIALMGLWLGDILPGRRRIEGRFPAGDALRKILRLVPGEGGSGACFPLGMILGLLPCGLVYAALLASVREGMEATGAAEGFLRGVFFMALFGAGTVPSLLLVGQAVALASPRLRAGLYRASGALLVLLGIIFAVRGALP